MGFDRRERGLRINDKSRLISRPAIIFKKLAHGFFFVVPTTTKKKVGSWYVPFRHADRNMLASIHQARAIDHPTPLPPRSKAAQEQRAYQNP